MPIIGVNGQTLDTPASAATGNAVFYEIVFNRGIVNTLIWFMLFACSTIALAMVIYCIKMLRRQQIVPAKIVKQLNEGLEKQDMTEAYSAVREDSSLLSQIMRIVFVHHQKGEAAIQEAVSNTITTQCQPINHKISSLLLCGNLAPMLGLLGTVTGMVGAFMGLGAAVGPEKASTLAFSISQSLYATAAGLLIAVPSLALAHVFRNLLEKRITEVLAQVERVTDRLQ